MRGSRISHPLPDGKGFFVSAALPSRPARRSSRRRVVSCVVGVVAAFLAVGISARADGNVSVTLHVDLAQYGTGATLAECDVSVPEEADGIAVLNAAEAQGCIDSWTPKEFPFGTYVECINDICAHEIFIVDRSAGAGTYWAMRENGDYTLYGVDGFEAQAGDELSFTYETWGLTPLPSDPGEAIPDLEEVTPPEVPSLPY